MSLRENARFAVRRVSGRAKTSLTSRTSVTTPARASGTGHPIIRSLEPGETWLWCTVDEQMVDASAGA